MLSRVLAVRWLIVTICVIAVLAPLGLVYAFSLEGSSAGGLSGVLSVCLLMLWCLVFQILVLS